MAGDGQDWTQPATIASGIVQAVAGSQVEGAAGVATNADGATWTDIAPTAGRTVLSGIITNRGAVDLQLAFGVASATVRHTLKPGDSIPVAFAGTIRLRSASAAAGSFDWLLFEV